MAIGNERNPDRLKPIHFQALASALQVRPKLVMREVIQMLEAIDAAFESGAKELHNAIGYSPAYERVHRAVLKRVRALRRNIRDGG